jgi:hypothetical protein
MSRSVRDLSSSESSSASPTASVSVSISCSPSTNINTSQNPSSRFQVKGERSDAINENPFVEAEQLFDRILLKSVDVREGTIQSQVKKFDSFMRDIEEWEAFSQSIEELLSGQEKIISTKTRDPRIEISFDAPIEQLYQRLNNLKDLSSNPLLSLSETLMLITELKKINRVMYGPETVNTSNGANTSNPATSAVPQSFNF